ncbi:MAG: hypothetical protein U1F66_13430 [bacterium]
MKPKITVLMSLAGFLLGMGLMAIPGAGASVSIQAKDRAPSTFSDRRCEKCRRGDDGKMVCEPVACP